MEPCKSEIDVTIVDRISAVLNPQPICNYNLNPSARDAMVNNFILHYSKHLFKEIQKDTKI